MSEQTISYAPPDPKSVIKHVFLTHHETEGGDGSRAGGISILFATPLDAKRVFTALTDQGSGHFIKRSNFGCVQSGENKAAAALCISAKNNRMIHIESLGKKTISCLNGALADLFGEKLPMFIMEKIRSSEAAIQPQARGA